MAFPDSERVWCRHCGPILRQDARAVITDTFFRHPLWIALGLPGDFQCLYFWECRVQPEPDRVACSGQWGEIEPPVTVTYRQLWNEEFLRNPRLLALRDDYERGMVRE